MNLEFRAMPVFGAHVVGWDFEKQPSANDIDDLRTALLRYKMLLLPRRVLSPTELKLLTTLFGRKLFVASPNFWDSQEHKEVVHMTNQCKEGISNCACESWHCDGHYLKDPCGITVMNMIQSAPGGAISVCDLQTVFEKLPSTVKQGLTKLRCLNEGSGVVQPLVIRHPFTGRLGLYINMYAQTIDMAGNKMPQVDSLLNEILVQCCYKHEWETGDIMIVDNFALCHRVCPADPTKEEIFQRSQTVLSGTWWTAVRQAAIARTQCQATTLTKSELVASNPA